MKSNLKIYIFKHGMVWVASKECKVETGFRSSGYRLVKDDLD